MLFVWPCIVGRPHGDGLEHPRKSCGGAKGGGGGAPSLTVGLFVRPQPSVTGHSVSGFVTEGTLMMRACTNRVPMMDANGVTWYHTEPLMMRLTGGDGSRWHSVTEINSPQKG